MRFKIWWKFVATLVRRRPLLFGVILLSFILASFFIYTNRNEFVRPTVTEGIVGTYEEKDLPELVTNLLSKSLVKLDRSGTPVNELAQSVESNKEGNLYTLRIKDANWLDGTRIKASDIEFNIPDVEATVVDDNTIQFKLADSFAPFPTLLNKPVLKKGTLMGTGPYFISEVKKDRNYVRRIVLKTRDPYLPKVVIKFYPNEKTAKSAIRLGEVQVLMGGEMAEQPYKQLSEINYQQLVMIVYNTKDAILSDENFRLALSLSCPVIKGEAEAKTSLPPASWAFNPNVKDYLENPQAKNYLDKVKNGRDTTIILTTVAPLKEVGEKVVGAWNKMGIKARVQIESGIPQNFQALLITQNIPADPDQYSLWHSTQTKTNISNLSSPRVDKDLEDGRRITDLEIRKQRYQDFQRVLLDQAPATFLYFPKFNVVYLSKIESDLKKVLGYQLPKN